LAGLSAAHRLIELTQGKPFAIELFEASDRLGGLVGTQKIGDYLVDVGGDSFLTNKPAAVDLCKRLGIEDRLIPTDTRYRGALVIRDGKPIPVPDGFQLLTPTAIWPVMKSPLFSVWGKLRILVEWFVPARRVPADPGSKEAPLQDESLADFVRRRFGREALDRLIQPLVGGIYTSDPEQLSLLATMPRFLQMERDYGSLIRAALKMKKRTDELTEVDDSSSGARYGLFAGLKGGMQDLVDALVSRIESSCKVRRNTVVASVSTERDRNPSSAPGYILKLADGRQERFDGVIVAASGTRIASLVDSLDADLSAKLRQIEYASSAIIVSGYKFSDINHPLDSFGVVVPHAERRRILAVSFSSRKFPDRAPEGRVLLRTFVGGAMQPEQLERSDSELLQVVREELGELLGVHGEPETERVFRYDNAMPQYHVGHLDRIRAIEESVAKYKGLALAGIGFHGVGIPDVIATGERAAESTVSVITSSDH
jgi:oxygen-dependent protoporphyrinogen oxidase